MVEKYTCVAGHTMPTGVGGFKRFDVGVEYGRDEIAAAHGEVPSAFFGPVSEPNAAAKPPEGPKKKGKGGEG